MLQNALEKDHPYQFFRANQWKVHNKIYSLTQCDLNMKEYDWHILASNDDLYVFETRECRLEKRLFTGKDRPTVVIVRGRNT